MSGQNTCRDRDRETTEIKENSLVLQVQNTSSSGELQKLKAQQEFTTSASFRGWISNWRHQNGHTKTTCKQRPCKNIFNCKIQEKNPRLKNKISFLQTELKDLQKQEEKQKSELKAFWRPGENYHRVFLLFICWPTTKQRLQSPREFQQFHSKIPIVYF